MPKLQTKSTIPTELVIDGVRLTGAVKRLTNAEYDAYARAFDRWDLPRGDQPESPAAKETREAEVKVWMRDSLEQYFTLAEGEYEHDDRPVTRGGELYDIFCNRGDVVPQALTLVLFENRLSAEEKKTLRWVLASKFGSTSGRLPTATGSAPAPIADGAALSGSAPAEAVPGGLSEPSSGMTDPSC